MSLHVYRLVNPLENCQVNHVGYYRDTELNSFYTGFALIYCYLRSLCVVVILFAKYDIITLYLGHVIMYHIAICHVK